MSTIAQAEKALVRNWPTVAAYIGATVALIAAFDLTHAWLDTIVPPEMNPKPGWYITAEAGMDLLILIGIAAIQAVAFAAMGREIDRPLWKCEDAMEALRNFFPIWLMVSLIMLAITRIEVSLAHRGLDEALQTMLLPHLFWSGAYMPLGVCIMYGGRLVWSEIPGRLAPLLHVLPKAVTAFLLGIMQFFIWLSVIPLIPKSAVMSTLYVALLNVALLLLECLAFAVMWHACMESRDTAPERDDDFDF